MERQDKSFRQDRVILVLEIKFLILKDMCLLMKNLIKQRIMLPRIIYIKKILIVMKLSLKVKLNRIINRLNLNDIFQITKKENRINILKNLKQIGIQT